MTGVYDSGLGGLTVLKELIAQRGKRDYLYFADSKYCPYGLKSKDFLRERAAEVSRFLIDQGADMIVVACNTATAAAISHLRETFDIPFVGMEPAIKPAILNTRSGVVGVLATAVTFTGELYHKTLEHYTAGQGNIKVIEQVGYGLVEAVESGRIHRDTPRRPGEWQFFSSASFTPEAAAIIDSMCGGHKYCLKDNIL